MISPRGKKKSIGIRPSNVPHQEKNACEVNGDKLKDAIFFISKKSTIFTGYFSFIFSEKTNYLIKK